MSDDRAANHPSRCALPTQRTIELYRVVDYRHQSLPQQLFGLKTITIYSGTGTIPQLDMIGIKAGWIFVQRDTQTCEFNKKRKGKGIYEITNRP